VALMGNVPPLEVGVRGTAEETASWAWECLASCSRAPGGLAGMILSFWGGVSSGTKVENIEALLTVAREWRPATANEGLVPTQPG